MKYGDVQKLREAGLITDDQRQKIIEHYRLKEDGGKFLAIISFVGSALVVAGIVLLISANWNEIPRGVKIAAGLALMLGAHAGGWWLREVQGKYRKTGEALHLAGSLLFLANIALIAQVYHISSRAPNAFLLWFAGIVALPWLLRSKAQHVLTLLALGVWFGIEVNQGDSAIRLRDECQVVGYSLLGLIYVGFGYVLRRGRFASFAKATERLGLLGLLIFAYPITWKGFLDAYDHNAVIGSSFLLTAMAVLSVALVALGARNLALDKQWRWTWGLALAVAACLLAGAFYAPKEGLGYFQEFTLVNVVAAIGLFVFCLLQIQVGIQERSTFLVNLGVVFIGLDIVSAYLGLFGTMARTGLMFVISGAFLILFGVYLENKRRALMKRINTAKAAPENR